MVAFLAYSLPPHMPCALMRSHTLFVIIIHCHLIAPSLGNVTSCVTVTAATVIVIVIITTTATVTTTTKAPCSNGCSPWDSNIALNHT